MIGRSHCITIINIIVNVGLYFDIGLATDVILFTKRKHNNVLMQSKPFVMNFHNAANINLYNWLCHFIIA